MKLIHIILVMAIVYIIWDPDLCIIFERFAPLTQGTFPNNYSVGKCNVDFSRSDCMVGNCPLGSTISNKEYCNIQCAQEPDKKLRDECEKHCMNLMKSCE